MKKKELDEKHKALVQSFAEKYSHKVETELKKEVDTGFKDKLNEKIAQGKKLLEKSLNNKFEYKKAELIRKLNEELKSKENILKEDFKNKLNELKDKFSKDLRDKENLLKTEFEKKEGKITKQNIMN